jgi:hypothetical protein
MGCSKWREETVEMPDLTTHAYWHCETAESYAKTVPGSKGATYEVTLSAANRGEYQYNWHCTCPGFRFRKTCKHVKAVQKEHCGWLQFADGGEPKNGKCPECGANVKAQNWAV